MDAKNELTIAFFKMRLLIDTTKLDRELIEQPSHYFEVATQAARASSRTTAAAEDLKREEAVLYREVADGLEKAGMKSTEAAIKNGIQIHPNRMELFEKLQAATLETAEWQALRESFSSRAYMLRDLCQLTMSGYLATETVKSGPATEARAAVNKAAAAEKSKKARWRENLEE